MSKQAFWHCPYGQANQLSFEECPYCHRKKKDNQRRGRKPCDYAEAKEVEHVKICLCGAVHFVDKSSGPEGRWRYLRGRRRLAGTVSGWTVVSLKNPFIHADSASLSKSGALQRFMEHTKNKYPWASWKKRGYRIAPVQLEVTK